MIEKLGNGNYAIVCRGKQRARPCSVCKRTLKDYKLCDFPVGGKKTCDKVLCTACATHKDPDLDYCPDHAKLLTPEGRMRF